jgi:hypothetical protein
MAAAATALKMYTQRSNTLLLPNLVSLVQVSIHPAQLLTLVPLVPVILPWFCVCAGTTAMTATGCIHIKTSAVSVFLPADTHQNFAAYQKRCTFKRCFNFKTTE